MTSVRVAVAGALALALMAAPMRAADHEFDDIVRAISEQFHTRPIHIPFMGLAKFVVAVAHPAGTKQLNLAIFQDLDEDRGRGRTLLDSVRMAVGKNWTPFVQVRSERDQNVLVYMVGKGNDVRLLVTTMDRDQVVVVETRVSPEAMQRWIKSPNEAAQAWLGRGERGSRHRDIDN